MNPPRRHSLRRNVSYDELLPRKYKDMDDWIASHPQIKPYISWQIEGDKTSSPDPFPKRRYFVHNRTIKDLNSFQASLEGYCMQLQNELEKFQDEDVEIQIDSDHTRKCKFLADEIIELRMNIVAKKIFMIMERQKDIQSLVNLISYDVLIPQDKCIRLSPSFLKLSFRVPNEMGITLQKMKQKLESMLTVSPKPAIWVSDYKGFFEDVVRSYEEALAVSKHPYVSPLPIDSQLSSCLMHLFPERIATLTHATYTELPNALIEECKMMIPQGLDVSGKRASISMMALFRVVYELVVVQGGKTETETDPELIKRVMKMQTEPKKNFSLPKFVDEEVPETMSIRQFFLRIPAYKEAADFMTMAMFASNPADALYQVHLCMKEIERELKVRMKVPEYENQIICFDDMFIIFLGVFMASDLLDVFRVAKLIDRFLCSYVSMSSFEHTKASLIALSLYVSNRKE